MTVSSFSDLGLIEPILRALTAENFVTPTPIQTQAIPLLLAGKDLLGIAQTGTGKTAAFALPILQRLTEAKVSPGPRGVRALVLAPTRELAIQIGASFRAYGKNLKLRHTVVYGGVGAKPQVDSLLRGVDILIATPGRLLDLMGQGHIRLDAVTNLVLDEADRMLDMGFIRDVRKILAHLPKQRQSQFFSATMPDDVTRLSREILVNPVRVEVTPTATTVDRVEQRVYFINAGDKRSLLVQLLQDPAFARVMVFTRTKHGANRVAEQLANAGIGADAIHGNKSQGARQRALEQFRSGRARVLVATDIAARGIDVDGVSHVINFEIPNMPDSYVHRIGRTARAGATGIALSFCDGSERGYLRDIERLTRTKLTVVEHKLQRPTASAAPEQRPAAPAKPAQRPGRPGDARPRGQKRFRRGGASRAA